MNPAKIVLGLAVLTYLLIAINCIIQYRRRKRTSQRIGKWRVVKGGGLTKEIILDEYEHKISS